jgi:SAM-dependent MidA family methyltransferase
MAMALDDPDEGYYAVRARIGEGGDFVTAPTISPLFARCVARRFAEDSRKMDTPLVFLEAAAGTGVFLRDFRASLAEIDPPAARRTSLWALERSGRGRAKIEQTGAADRIFADVSEIPPSTLTGWIFSNELYDALPVHRVRMGEAGLLELGVTLSGTGFAWTAWPAPAELSEYLAKFGVALAEGQLAEINLAAAPLHRALCRSLRAGRIVSFDYGHRAEILYHPHARPLGTLAVHSGGRRGGDPLENPGLVDLTAHVNWDDLRAAGEAEGFRSERVCRLSEFLAGAGLFEDAARDKISALRLFDPEGIGDVLSVLIQSIGV